MSTTSAALSPTTTAVGDGPYGYTPTTSVCVIFVILFGFSCALHLFQAIKWRTWWMIPTMALGCLGETIGWSGRLWSSRNHLLMDPFLMQITSTIISPSFMSAANFTILGFIIRKLGVQYSWLTPRWYLIVFITLDLVSLVIQSLGGARASGAKTGTNDADIGAKIMLGGIITQMVAITVYVGLAIHFFIRFHQDRPVRGASFSSPSQETLGKERRGMVDRKMKLMLAGMAINTLFLYIRAIYRTIELNDGWDGEIITNQSLFNWLDGMPITICTYAFNILHPGYLLDLRQPAPVDDEKQSQTSS